MNARSELHFLMKHTTLFTIVTALFLPVFLADCAPGGVALSPEQVAIREVINRPGSRAMVDQSTLKVRQSVQVDQKTFVVVTYTQIEDNRQDKCQMVYQTERAGIGWKPLGGGGGCTGTTVGQPQPAAPPVEANCGWNSGSRMGDPGYSYTAGSVNLPDIVKVRITWTDGQPQEANVINSSFLAVRPGQLNFQKIEGFNAAGDLVYTNEPQVAPGKVNE